jgi:threonine dehydrogenase-like Zn-dependent dehydrogenase
MAAGHILTATHLKNVKKFQIGDRVAADNSELCGHCFYCQRGEPLLCENVRRNWPNAAQLCLVTD